VQVVQLLSGWENDRCPGVAFELPERSFGRALQVGVAQRRDGSGGIARPRFGRGDVFSVVAAWWLRSMRSATWVRPERVALFAPLHRGQAATRLSMPSSPLNDHGIA